MLSVQLRHFAECHDMSENDEAKLLLGIKEADAHGAFKRSSRTAKSANHSNETIRSVVQCKGVFFLVGTLSFDLSISAISVWRGENVYFA